LKEQRYKDNAYCVKDKFIPKDSLVVKTYETPNGLLRRYYCPHCGRLVRLEPRKSRKLRERLYKSKAKHIYSKVIEI